MRRKDRFNESGKCMARRQILPGRLQYQGKNLPIFSRIRWLLEFSDVRYAFCKNPDMTVERNMFRDVDTRRKS